MSKMADKIYLLGTYCLSVFNIVLDFELIKSIVVFVFTMVLLIIQIKLHYKRLKKEDEEKGKKN